eukprot:309778-Pleurochrysis_carterae.AAC.3
MHASVSPISTSNVLPRSSGQASFSDGHPWRHTFRAPQGCARLLLLRQTLELDPRPPSSAAHHRPIRRPPAVAHPRSADVRRRPGSSLYARTHSRART